MATIKGDYILWYLDGRSEKLLRHDFTAADIADKVVNGVPIREELQRQAQSAAAALASGKTKRRWIADNEDWIKTAGEAIDADTAYEAWLQGRIDELAYSLEDEVITELNSRFSEDDEDEEGDEDEGEDAEGDDDEDPDA